MKGRYSEPSWPSRYKAGCFVSRPATWLQLAAVDTSSGQPTGHIKVGTKVLVKVGVSKQDCNSRHTKQLHTMKQSQDSNARHVCLKVLAAQQKLS
jgi:hypothetical protein